MFVQQKSLEDKDSGLPPEQFLLLEQDVAGLLTASYERWALPKLGATQV